jgi:phenolic acid decarboxylase
MLPATAKVECIRKIKGGYRIAIANYMRGYYEWESPAEKTVCYAHTLMDVKKNSKSKYKYVIKKINSIVYCKHQER